MNVIKNFSPLLKDKELIDDLPIVIRVRKFDEAQQKNFPQPSPKLKTQDNPYLPIIIDSYGGQVYSLMSMISDIHASRIPGGNHYTRKGYVVWCAPL